MKPVTVSYKSLGLSIPELEAIARPFTERKGRARKIIDAGLFDGDFEKFIKSRDKDYQVGLLGPTRYKLWNDGKVRWQDMIDPKTGRLRLLKKDKKGEYIGLQ